MTIFSDDMTLMPQIRMMESIVKNQKETLRQAVEEHPGWDPLLRHDIIHHCLNQNTTPVRLEDDTDITFHSKMLMYRQKLDSEQRLGNCMIMLIASLDKLAKYSKN